MSHRCAVARATAVALTVLSLLVAPTDALATARPGISFTQMQQKFMCTVCHEALPVARSPEAYQENTVLRGLIAQGDDERQIVSGMVAQYSTAVLAEPPTHGFSLLVYVIPGVVVLGGLLTVIIVLPSWRRRTRERTLDGSDDAASRSLSVADSQRLDAELARDA